LDQVEKRDVRLRVIAGDRHHEPQVRLDQTPLRVLVALVLPAGELALFFTREQRTVADLAHVELERIRGRCVLGAYVLSREGRLHRRLYRRHPRSALESPNRLGLRWKGTDTDMEKGFARTNVRNRRI